MQTIAEWYNQQKSRREAERQKQDRLMSTYFQQKAKLGENKLANDKTVSFVKERLKSSLGEDYEKFEEQLSGKINLSKIKEQYPYSYGEKYSLLVDDMLKKYQKGEQIETEMGTLAGTLSTITGKDFTTALEGKSLEEKQELAGEQVDLINEFKSYNDALVKSGIEVDYSDVTSLEEAYNKAKDKYVDIQKQKTTQQRQKDREKVSRDIVREVGTEDAYKMNLEKKSLSEMKWLLAQVKYKKEQDEPVKETGAKLSQSQENKLITITERYGVEPKKDEEEEMHKLFTLKYLEVLDDIATSTRHDLADISDKSKLIIRDLTDREFGALNKEKSIKAIKEKLDEHIEGAKENENLTIEQLSKKQQEENEMQNKNITNNETKKNKKNTWRDYDNE